MGQVWISKPFWTCEKVSCSWKQFTISWKCWCYRLAHGNLQGFSGLLLKISISFKNPSPNLGWFSVCTCKIILGFVESNLLTVTLAKARANGSLPGKPKRKQAAISIAAWGLSLSGKGFSSQVCPVLGVRGLPLVTWGLSTQSLSFVFLLTICLLDKALNANGTLNHTRINEGKLVRNKPC